MCGSRYWVKGCVEVNRWPDVLGNRLDLLCHPDSSVEFHPHLRVNCWSSSQFTQPADSLQRRIYSFSSFIQPKACGFPQLPNSVHQLFWMPWIVEYPSKGSSCIKPWSSSVPLQNSSPSNRKVFREGIYEKIFKDEMLTVLNFTWPLCFQKTVG